MLVSNQWLNSPDNKTTFASERTVRFNSTEKSKLEKHYALCNVCRRDVKYYSVRGGFDAIHQ